MRLYFESYGCALNRGESNEMAETALAMGHSITASPLDADMLVLDTCVVVQATEDRMMARLQHLAGLGRTVVVAGCLPPVRRARVLELCPAALLLPPGKKSSFGALLKSVRPRPLSAPTPIEDGGAAGLPDGGTAWNAGVVAEVPIADGCRGACTYCLARVARGELHSREPEEIVARVRKLAEAGSMEIRLTALDCGLYGLDRGTDLPSLLERLGDLEGGFRLRVGMMNPDSLEPIFDRLMAAFEGPRLFKTLHLPVQSGDDGVLERMGRRYRASDFLELAGRFRRRFPRGLLATDVIVGFPGEGKREFERTLGLVEEARPDMVNVKAYSPRPLTRAADWNDRTGRDEVRERIAGLNALRRRLSLENNLRLVGVTEEVLVTEKARRGVLARTAGYYPVVVGDGPRPGEPVRVVLREARPGYLRAMVDR